MSLHNDDPDELPPEPRRKSVGEQLASVAIPLGYVLFVLVPMIFTIRFAMQQLEKKNDADPPPEVAEKARPDADPPPRPEPKPKVPRPPKKKAPVEPEEKEPPVPVVPGAVVAPAPRDLTAELERAVLASRVSNPALRLEAAATLGRFVGKSDPTLRRKAALALSEMGGDAEPAHAALRAVANDADEVVRALAQRALDNGTAAAAKRKELDALAPALRAKEPEDRIRALNKVATYGRDAGHLTDAVIDLLRDKEKSVREAAADVLGKLTPDAKTIALCVTGLQAKDAKARIETLEQVGALGAEARCASEYLVEAALDRAPGVQAAAFKALERAHPALHPHVVALFHGQPAERRAALVALAELGADAAPAAPLLLVVNDKPELWGTDPHHDVFPTLAAVAPRDKRFVAAVLAAVAAPNPRGGDALAARRRAGLAQLVALAAPVEDKVAALQAASKDHVALAEVFRTWLHLSPGDKRFAVAVLDSTRAAAPPARVAAGVGALDLIDVPLEDKVAALHTALNNGYRDGPVFDALVRLDPADKRCAAAVLALVAAPEVDSAARARRLVGLAYLGKVAATEKQAADALDVALNDPGTVAQVFAAFARVAPKDRRFVGAVLDAVADPNPNRSAAVRDRRLAALGHLRAVDAGDARKVEVLVSGLGDKATQVAVIRALAEFGASAKPALPALKELKGSTNEAVRDAAITAIVKIEAAK